MDLKGLQNILLGNGQQKWYKGSVMTSLNWIISIFFVFYICLINRTESNLLIIIFTTILIIFLFFWIYIFRFFAIKDPNRLQTEKYNLEQQALNLKLKDKKIENSQKPKMIEVNNKK